jgi:hypothetical protein
MNNYDVSSTGENIELNVYYDTWLSQIYFDDWLNGSDGYEVNKIDLGGRDNYLYLIGESEAPFYKKSELSKKPKAELFELMYQYDLLSYNADINDYKKSEYIEDLMGVSILRHYEWLASQYYWHDISANIPHNYFISCGYSQGDAVYIVKIDGLTKEYKKYIDNIFWDCPIYFYIEINGTEIAREWDILNDCYEWNIDAIKEKITALDISDYAKNWIIDRLPDYPDYH